MRLGICAYMNLYRVRFPIREERIARDAGRADNRQGAASRRAVIQGATTMGLFKSKRDIPDEEIYRPGDRYFDPELVKSSDLMRRWSDLYNAHEASTHVVEEGYTVRSP